MVSNLKWRAGFGWPTLMLFAAPTAIAVLSDGPVRVIAVTFAILMLIFIVYQWRKWNKRGWHQAHYRGMLVYARTAGFEASTAEIEGRPFSKINACRAMALAMAGPSRVANVDAMIAELAQERGHYFAYLLNKFGAKAEPKFNAEALRIITQEMQQLEFGPQLVIGNIVENTYGGEEAARYVLALALNKAR